MQQRDNKRATFAEVFSSIKFGRKSETGTKQHWPEPGFAANTSTHLGEADLDDYKKALPSSN